LHLEARLKMDSHESSEVRRLLSILCDGEISEAEQARLIDLLGSSADNRRHYLEYLDLHARLLAHRSEPSLSSFADEQSSSPIPAAQPLESLSFSSIDHQPGTRTTGLERDRNLQIWRYALVACVTLASSLFFQFFLTRGPWHSRLAPGSEEHETLPAVYVATLTHAADCVWENPGAAWRPGSRLMPSELRLASGIARIHFDSGADLVVQGPAVLRIRSHTAATVLFGRLVFKADETAYPFDLQTPSSNLLDIGTEYAIAVGPEGEEIHVFDGEVERTPKSGTLSPQGAEHLGAGEARRYEASTMSQGKPTALDPTKFVREFPAPKPPLADPAAGLTAYEGFDYADPKMLDQGQANGGLGWSSAWRVGFARPAPDVDKNLLPLNVRESLIFPGSSARSIGGSFEFTGFTKYFRRMVSPIRLDRDGVYYISYLFRREGPQTDPQNAVVVLLRTSDELEGELTRNQPDFSRRMNLGVEKYNDLFTSLQKVGARTPLPLTFGETYLLVVKIVASAANPDQIFMRVYAPGEPLEREEPSSWSVVGPSFQSDLVFDWLEVHINSKKRQTIDEIRVGTSWSSVAAPWMKAAASKPLE
jgi:hypothetical protein